MSRKQRKPWSASAASAISLSQCPWVGQIIPSSSLTVNGFTWECPRCKSPAHTAARSTRGSHGRALRRLSIDQLPPFFLLKALAICAFFYGWAEIKTPAIGKVILDYSPAQGTEKKREQHILACRGNPQLSQRVAYWCLKVNGCLQGYISNTVASKSVPFYLNLLLIQQSVSCFIFFFFFFTMLSSKIYHKQVRRHCNFTFESLSFRSVIKQDAGIEHWTHAEAVLQSKRCSVLKYCHLSTEHTWI